ncbi:MAG TPA: hypothetical protein VEB41_03400 [Burkholderiales bacterium]|nr:hypothetical protein [Burkholderiales bacterium]
MARLVVFLLFLTHFPHGVAMEGPVLRQVLDTARGRAWTLAPDGVHVHSLPERRKIAHLKLPGWIVAGELYGCTPDLALNEWGDAVVTSDIVPVVWKVHAGSFAVSRHELVLDRDTDREVGFAAIAWSPRHRTFLAVSFHHGTLWRIDPLLRRAQKVALSSPLPGACQLALRGTKLCVYTPQEWTVHLAPDLRSAHAARKACVD